MTASGKFRWAYLPVILVLGLIWYEFWRAGRNADSLPQEAQPLASTTVAPSEPVRVPMPEGPVEPLGVPPERPMLRIPPVEATPTGGPRAAPEEVRFSADLPPITARGSDMTLEQVVATLNKAMGPQSQLTAGQGNNSRFTFDAKDKAFWEIFRDLAQQNPLECGTGATTVQLAAGTGIRALGGDAGGLQLQATGTGYHRFEINGPAILVGTSMALQRSTVARGPANPESRCLLTLIAAADPRLHLAGPMNFTEMSVRDETGRTVGATPAGTSFGTPPGNAQLFNVSWVAADNAKKVTLTCTLQFAALLSEVTVSMSDVLGRTNEIITLGPARYSVTVAQMNTPAGAASPQRVQVRVQPPDGESRNLAIRWELLDSAGTRIGTSPVRLTSNGGASPLTLSTITVPTGSSGPFRLVVHGPAETRNFSLPFVLADLPLP